MDAAIEETARSDRTANTRPKDHPAVGNSRRLESLAIRAGVLERISRLRDRRREKTMRSCLAYCRALVGKRISRTTACRRRQLSYAPSHRPEAWPLSKKGKTL